MTTTEGGNTIILYGAGGHAKSVIGVLETQGAWRLAGLLEDGPVQTGKRVLGYEVIGNRVDLIRLRGMGIDGGLVAVGDNVRRLEIARDMERAGLKLVNIVHPTAYLMKDAAIGRGSFVHADAVIGPECRIGEHAIIHAQTCIGHESIVGICAQLTPGVRIGGQARIGDFAFFGMGAMVFPKVTVGRNVSVAANTVVHKDLDDNVVVAGNPARVIRTNPTLPGD